MLKSSVYKKILQVSRVSKTKKGGRSLSFRVIAIIGNFSGGIGLGIGKAKDVSKATEKAYALAKKNFFCLSSNYLYDAPIFIKKKYYNNIFIFKNTKNSSEIKAAKFISPIFEFAGLKGIVLKIIGSRNSINTIKGAIKLLKHIY